MKRGHQTNKERNKHTSRLLDQLGPEGRVGEKAENIFETYINLWTTMKFGFQDQLFIKKRRKIYRVLYLVDVGQKR